MWPRLSAKQQKQEIAEWEKERPLREQARIKAGKVDEVPEDDEAEFIEALSKAKKLHSLPAAPAMPVLAHAAIASCTEQSVANEKFVRSVAPATAKVLDREHQSKISPKGHASEEYYALVHTPIPLKKAMQIPKAKQALDDEWDKLGKKAWDVSKVQPMAKVKEDAKRRGKEVHFATLQALCHENIQNLQNS